jgi:hypothetical protein
VFAVVEGREGGREGGRVEGRIGWRIGLRGGDKRKEGEERDKRKEDE